MTVFRCAKTAVLFWALLATLGLYIKYKDNAKKNCHDSGMCKLAVSLRFFPCIYVVASYIRIGDLPSISLNYPFPKHTESSLND